MPNRSGFSSSRPTSGLAWVRVTSAPKRAAARRAEERERLRLALRPHRLERLVLEDALGRRDTSAPRPTIPFTGAAPCNREAVMTTSPVTIPSPSSGRAPRGDDSHHSVDPDPHLQRECWVFCVQLLNRLQDA